MKKKIPKECVFRPECGLVIIVRDPDKISPRPTVKTAGLLLLFLSLALIFFRHTLVVRNWDP